MTNEEILKESVGKKLNIDFNDRSWWLNWWVLLDPEPSFKAVLSAMDAAREDEAVAILDFVDKGNWWSEDGLWSNEPEWQNLTSAQLYQLYLKHKKQNP